jgi:hypothetical protein
VHDAGAGLDVGRGVNPTTPSRSGSRLPALAAWVSGAFLELGLNDEVTRSLATHRLIPG